MGSILLVQSRYKLVTSTGSMYFRTISLIMRRCDMLESIL